MSNTVPRILTCNQVVRTHYVALIRVVHSWMIFRRHKTFPQVVFQPTFFRVDSLGHAVLSKREKSSHVIADVSIASDKVHV